MSNKVKKKKNNKNKKTVKKVTKNKQVKKVKVRKIKYGRLLLVLVILFLIFYLLNHLINFPIKNIFIYNNTNLKDQEIIELAKIENYPSIFSMTSSKIENNIKKNVFIKSVDVKKKKLKEVHIYIEENKVLFYNKTSNKTILENGKEIEGEYNGPVLLNYVPDTIYTLLIEKMKMIDNDILKRVSEIKYDPNNVDEERFLIYMNDGNYVYITLEKIENINDYIDIIKTFENKKGILYLDSGEYFQVFKD